MITCFIRDEFPRKEQFIRREDRLFLRQVSAPHAPLIRP